MCEMPTAEPEVPTPSPGLPNRLQHRSEQPSWKGHLLPLPDGTGTLPTPSRAGSEIQPCSTCLGNRPNNHLRSGAATKQVVDKDEIWH